MFNGKTHYKWPFSMAMLNYQRVYNVVGGLEHVLVFHMLGISIHPNSQLTFTPSFFRGVGLNHQPVIVFP